MSSYTACSVRSYSSSITTIRTHVLVTTMELTKIPSKFLVLLHFYSKSNVDFYECFFMSS